MEKSAQERMRKKKSARYGLPVPTVAAVFGVAVGSEPGQKRANAAVRQSDTGIGSSAIEIDRVAVRGQRVATRKHNVLDIAMTLVVRLGGLSAKPAVHPVTRGESALLIVQYDCQQ